MSASESMNLLYAQSGGVTSVINSTAQAVIEEAGKQKSIGKIFCANHGIVGVLKEDIFDLSSLSQRVINKIGMNPGGVFGSCRFKLKDPKHHNRSFDRLLEVFSAHNIHYFLYNGGGDSADTSYKISQYANSKKYDLSVIHIPKTIDNDLAYTDCSPGFASVAKYVAVSTQETSLDLASMHVGSTKVFVFEVMGRHAGWIAASAGLAQTKDMNTPLIILFPEIPFDSTSFLKKVNSMVKAHGYVSVVVSEGIISKSGSLMKAQLTTDSFGHKKLGGVGSLISKLIEEKLKFKSHTACSDYLQRASRHLASLTDIKHAMAVGSAAVKAAIKKQKGKMVSIKRTGSKPYRWKTELVSLQKIANKEKLMPKNFIDKEGYGITTACRNYLLPLIQGESSPPFTKGLPMYSSFHFPILKKRLGRMNGYRILMVAPPGAGKGTQSAILCKQYNLQSIACGDLLRAEAKSGSSLGKKLLSYMQKGELVPDELIISIMSKELSKNKYSNGYILDGFPRTLAQARALYDKNVSLDVIIELRVSNATVLDRLGGRWIHQPSGRVYHTKFNPPKNIGFDDETNEPLTQRVDDTPATIKNRLAIYEQETAPIVSYYQDLCHRNDSMSLHSLNGEELVNTVAKKIKKIIASIP